MGFRKALGSDIRVLWSEVMCFSKSGKYKLGSDKGMEGHCPQVFFSLLPMN